MGGNAVNMPNHLRLTAGYLSICQQITAFLIETFVNHQCPSEENVENVAKAVSFAVGDQASVTIFASVTLASPIQIYPISDWILSHKGNNRGLLDLDSSSKTLVSPYPH